MRYTHRLGDAGMAPSVGSRGEADDHALAESGIGLDVPPAEFEARSYEQVAVA